MGLITSTRPLISEVQMALFLQIVHIFPKFRLTLITRNPIGRIYNGNALRRKLKNECYTNSD